MASKLVIVESPAKAKTIGKYLGRGYTVKASLGHVRDLPKSSLGVDVDHDFAPKYVVPRDKNATVKDLKEKVQAARTVYLATDPDREGEAIAWHLVEATGAEPKQVQRVVFHEITRDAVSEAMQHARPIDMRLVDAQQARRVLDRLIGYKLSPLLAKKVRRGLSAGRVQSVALRLVADREREVLAFVPREYWRLAARLQPLDSESWGAFEAELVRVAGERVELSDRAAVDQVLRQLDGATYAVADVRQRESQRRPAAPFTTSTLQQEASRKLGFGVRRTMALAQELYEGIDLGGETEGLITYMRTDSVNVASVAQEAARTTIATRFGPDYLPATPNVYKTRAKGAQEAHEAIRPTDPARDPESVRARLTSPQLRLYRLIWQRFIASQMSPAVLDSTTIEIAAHAAGGTGELPICLFRATGSVIRFPGFLAVYREGVDDGEDGLEERTLPGLAKGNPLAMTSLSPSQHFTQPPPRYTEASLVKALEEAGIGRPSTYAPTIATLYERGYVVVDNKRVIPTELGILVNDLLVEHFPTIVDTGFTSTMEEDLDEIAAGEQTLGPVVAAFYGPFSASVDHAEAAMPKVKMPDEPAGEICDKCGREMVIKIGRYGKFIACPGFPEGRNAKPLLIKVGVACPQCQEGEIVEKRGGKGRTRIFYGCSRFPECDFTTWQRPVPLRCPVCTGQLVEAGRDGLKCLACDYTGPRQVDVEAEMVASPAD
jgi:DNA topoisomerase-1